MLHDDDEEEEGKAKKRKRPAPPKKGRGGSFKAQPPIENLEKKVAALKEALLYVLDLAVHV